MKKLERQWTLEEIESERLSELCELMQKLSHMSFATLKEDMAVAQARYEQMMANRSKARRWFDEFMCEATLFIATLLPPRKPHRM